MSIPATIAPHSLLDSSKIRAWCVYLASGKGIKSDTYINLRAFASATPTEAFTCIATDFDLYLLYCGNVLRGDGGFITLADFGEIT